MKGFLTVSYGTPITTPKDLLTVLPITTCYVLFCKYD